MIEKIPSIVNGLIINKHLPSEFELVGVFKNLLIGILKAVKFNLIIKKSFEQMQEMLVAKFILRKEKEL